MTRLEGLGSCSLRDDVIPVVSLEKDSDPADTSSSNEDVASRYLRHRNSYNEPTQLQTLPTTPVTVASALPWDFFSHLLHAQNTNAPIPKGPVRVRKASDSDQILFEGLQIDPQQRPAEMAVGRFRSRDDIVLHFMLELNMLWRDSALIFCGLLFQWFHSILTNLAYYYHTQLTAAQRVPLKDIAYDTLPVLNGSWWMVSEYLVFIMIAVIVISIASILVIRWNPPHGRPLYCVPILRRMLMTLTCCQLLRCVSFLVTTLPGASRQCLYHVPTDMTSTEMILGPADDRGNPPQWSPPLTVNDIIWRMDATNGCGDLMFSSHTIFTMVFVCLIWRYFNWGILKWSMLAAQLIIVPFILAAHKHYSVDVFTALYVTPLVFEVLRIKFRDLDVHSTDMASHYGVRFIRSFVPANQGDPVVIMCLRGGEFYMEPSDIPVDLQRAHLGGFYSKVDHKLSHFSCNDDSDISSEFEPFNV